MTEAVIVSAVRTAIGTARKGTLAATPAEHLATHILNEAIDRSSLPRDSVDDVIFAESMYGGGDLARYAAVAAGLLQVPGQAVNRHCAGGLTAVANAAGSIRSGMDSVIVAGGVNSMSLTPQVTWAVPGTEEMETRIAPTFPYRDDASDDTTLSVGWNIAQKYNLSRERMDAWAVRSHERAIAAIDSGRFEDEIAPIKVTRLDGSVVDFSEDEHPRRSTTLEKVAALEPVHPEIDGFSITAGNASGTNDAAAALTLTTAENASAHGLDTFGTVRAWASIGVDPRFTGDGSMAVIPMVLKRAGLGLKDVHLWEINEAFASVPVSVCQEFGLDEELVNIYGSGCSLGHPIAASGARMLVTLTHELRRRGGGIGVAAMCAGGGQGGAVVVEV
ncbi:thiolase family protein [Rhodococcus fascians]|nr:thiolase family protein [Rhodococcus fascians]MBY4140915.1 thiolase family protein [Rhodococcus fascians]MBY4219579.1 thiolase family protein [Rhodococcus fascians]MBY4221888.1 thiolase family protein [Rhodococcus fascians]MBY4233889.1 thiolase family protein [Rhodococcus fascians]